MKAELAIPEPFAFAVARGAADLAPCSERLAAIHGLLYGAVELMSGRILDIAEFETKVAFGRHIYELLDFARAVEGRVKELGRKTAPRHVPADDRALLDRILRAPGASHVVAGLYGTWLAKTRRAAERYLDEHDPLADQPTQRLIRMHLPALDEMAAWGAAAAAAYRAAQVAPEAVDAWVESLRAPIPAACEPFRRPECAARDVRFTTFSDTRDYTRATDFAPSGDAYEDEALLLIRTNRDEIDALETFALAIHDLLYEADAEALHDLARFAWDEARHAVLGHALLAARGKQPFAVHCNMVGIDVRARMRGWDALAQISLFGELSIIKPMRRLVEQARARGDAEVARSFDFICSDESLHLRRGLRWLRERHPAGSLEGAEQVVRRRAAVLLHELGIVNEDYAARLTRRDIARIVGE